MLEQVAVARVSGNDVGICECGGSGRGLAGAGDELWRRAEEGLAEGRLRPRTGCHVEEHE